MTRRGIAGEVACDGVNTEGVLVVESSERHSRLVDRGQGWFTRSIDNPRSKLSAMTRPLFEETEAQYSQHSS